MGGKSGERKREIERGASEEKGGRVRTRIRKRIKITDLGHIFAVEMVCQ